MKGLQGISEHGGEENDLRLEKNLRKNVLDDKNWITGALIQAENILVAKKKSIKFIWNHVIIDVGTLSRS